MHERSSMSEEQRKAAIALFATGWGAKSVATRLGAPARAIRRSYDR
jgi:transposase